MQQYCTYGSVRGASGQPASLPRQKAFDSAERRRNRPAPPRQINDLRDSVGQAFSLPWPFSAAC
jgi:hypothetical protein